MSAFIVLSLLAFMALSIPVAVAIGLSGVISLTYFTDMPLAVVAQRLFTSMDNGPLLAIPLFILAGNLMEKGGVSRRLIDFTKSIVGGAQGGLAITCVLTCMIFAAISGSGVATTFAIGSILIPAMVRHGYPVGKASALQATSAELGVIIPPSIPMILFAVATQVSVGELFIAGVIPGLMIGVSLVIYVWVWCRMTGHGKNDRDESLSFLTAARSAVLALFMPVVILGGIYGGIFTPTEASAVACTYALILGMFIYRELSLAALIDVLKKSAVTTSAIMLIIAFSGLFAYLLTRSGAAAGIASYVTEMVSSPLLFLLVVNVLLFLVGMFVDSAAAIIVLAPILTPIAISYGIDPVHFGVVMVINLAVGMITPPFGVNLFSACMISGISFEKIIRPLVPLVLVVMVCLGLVTYLPELSLWLRDLMYQRT